MLEDWKNTISFIFGRSNSDIIIKIKTILVQVVVMTCLAMMHSFWAYEISLRFTFVLALTFRFWFFILSVKLFTILFVIYTPFTPIRKCHILLQDFFLILLFFYVVLASSNLILPFFMAFFLLLWRIFCFSQLSPAALYC